jgi:hypothetical protein
VLFLCSDEHCHSQWTHTARSTLAQRMHHNVAAMCQPDVNDLEDGEFINIRVMQQDGGELQFKIKRKTTMKKLMDAWCKKKVCRQTEQSRTLSPFGCLLAGHLSTCCTHSYFPACSLVACLLFARSESGSRR